MTGYKVILFLMFFDRLIISFIISTYEKEAGNIGSANAKRCRCKGKKEEDKQETSKEEEEEEEAQEGRWLGLVYYRKTEVRVFRGKSF
jgi:hypothetical protein